MTPVAPWPHWIHEQRRLAPDGPTGGGGRYGFAALERETAAAALAAGLDEHEATATIRSGLDAGRQKPRRRPAAR